MEEEEEDVAGAGVFEAFELPPEDELFPRVGELSGTESLALTARR